MLFKRWHFWPSQIFQCFSRKIFYSIRICVSQRFKPMSFYSLLLRRSASSDAKQSRFRPRNLKIFFKDLVLSFRPFFTPQFCIFPVRYCGTGKCVDWRFSLKSLLSLAVKLPGCRNVPLPPFRFRNPKLSLCISERYQFWLSFKPSHL